MHFGIAFPYAKYKPVFSIHDHLSAEGSWEHPPCPMKRRAIAIETDKNARKGELKEKIRLA